MGTIIIVAILAVIAVVAARSGMKHMKGEGGCCGGGGDAVPEQHKTLKDAKIGEKTVHIEGMMCDNCRKHVEKQLDKIDGAVAHADWKKGVAVVEYDRDVSDDAIRQALAWTDYKVTSIEESK